MSFFKSYRFHWLFVILIFAKHEVEVVLLVISQRKLFQRLFDAVPTLQPHGLTLLPGDFKELLVFIQEAQIDRSLVIHGRLSSGQNTGELGRGVFQLLGFQEAGSAELSECGLQDGLLLLLDSLSHIS